MAGLNILLGIYSLFFVTSSIATTSSNGIYDITSYGAKANGDITQALAKAWQDACASTRPSKVVIQGATYWLTQATLQGPCKAPIHLQVNGRVQAPGQGKVNGDGWVSLRNIDHLTIAGKGYFDGKGKTSWGQKCDKTTYCGAFPINMRFDFITNSVVKEITSLDSKQFHVNVFGCNNLTFQHFTIKAPGNSINTDGIHIGRSTGIKILDSNIGTGDDCISLGDGAKQITVTNVNCGPGHGISIGSLGKYKGEQPVSGVRVKDCTLSNTLNGVRIKTWPASYDGSVSDVHFENITMVNVANPIIIDQAYCPWNKCNLKLPSKIKISKVSFKNIRGTSGSPDAVKILCSPAVPCQEVEMGDIDLKYNGQLGPIKSQCSNVRPKIYGKQNPQACFH